MTKKSFAFAKPLATVTPNPDVWVQDRALPPGPTKRFTVDVPAGLHRRVKLTCVERGLNMADVVRDLLEREFPEKPTA